MDRQWLKNLALSSFSDGRWHLAEPNSPAHLATEKVNESFEELYELVHKYVDVFNMHAPKFKQLKLFRLSHKPNTEAVGFAILLGPMQVQVERQGARYVSAGIYMRQPQSVRIPMRVFDARYDTFGDVFWVMDDKISLDLQRLAKQLLEDTCRLAYETKLFQDA